MLVFALSELKFKLLEFESLTDDDQTLPLVPTLFREPLLLFRLPEDGKRAKILFFTFNIKSFLLGLKCTLDIQNRKSTLAFYFNIFYDFRSFAIFQIEVKHLRL